MPYRRTRIKFCGMQSHADIRLSEAIGVDAVGFIFTDSPRRISVELASNLALDVSPMTAIFAVTANPSEEEAIAIRAALPRAVFQFCGDETADACAHLAGDVSYVKAVNGRMPPAPGAYPHPAMLLLDSAAGNVRGGTGVALPWNEIVAPETPFLLAGGLQAENVGEAIAILRPYAVDVRSGIETGGTKDEAKMHAFAAAVRRADQEIAHAAR